jgi:hypothetical protein
MTACAPIDRLMQTLRTQVPGATDDMLQLQLFNVMDEFFRRTLAWRYGTEIQLTQDTLEYNFTTPPDAAVVRMIGVTHQGLPMQPMGTAGSGGGGTLALGRYGSEFMFPDGDSRYGPELLGPPAGASSFSYAIYRPDVISITLNPDVEAVKYPLQAIMALTLDKGCLECDCADWAVEEWMYDAFFQDWLDGTLSKMYGMPAKPWSSAVHAQYHAKRFRNEMAFRKQDSNRGYAYGVAGWRFPRSGW